MTTYNLKLNHKVYIIPIRDQMENNLKVLNSLKEIIKNIEINPRRYKKYKDIDIMRVANLDKINVSILYIIDDSKKTVYIKDAAITKSSVTFKF